MINEFQLVIGNKPMVYLFLLVPVVFVLHIIFLRHSMRRAMKFSNFQAMKRVEGGKITTKYFTPLFFMIILICLLVIASMDITVYYPGEVSDFDYYLLLDSGASMTARDVNPDRFSFAKGISEGLIGNLSYSHMGFMSFGGYISKNVPPTNDVALLKKAVLESEITDYGTDMGLAVISSVEALRSSNKSKIIILVSDGHDTVGMPLADAVKIAQEEHVKVFTIGVGTKEGGSFISVPDSQGVISKLDEKNLQTIANVTGGKYLLVDKPEKIKDATEMIRTDSKEGYLDYDLTPICIISALLVLFFWWILENTRFRIFP